MPDTLLKFAVIAIGLLTLLYFGRRWLRRRRRPRPLPAVDLTLDVESLGTAGPPAEGVLVKFYNVPVHLAAIVVAPPDRLDAVFEAIVPGLGQAVVDHRPLIRRWPVQLSSTGFAHSFFRHVKLPGEGGKGTPWCAAAGMVKVNDQPVTVGLVLRSQSANNLGQTIVESETKWLDLVRIRLPQ